MPQAGANRSDLKRICESCQTPFVISKGRPEDFQMAYTPVLCLRCLPEIMKRCTPFSLNIEDTIRRAAPASLAKVLVKEPAGDYEHALQSIHNLSVNAFRGSEDDCRKLKFIADACILNLQIIATIAPEYLRPIAHDCLEWPFFIGQSLHHSAGAELVRRLELGKNALLKGNFKQNSMATPLARILWLWLSQNHSSLHLPNFSKTTVRLWFEVGWRCILLATDGKPFANPILHPLGASAVNKKSTSRGMANQTAAMLRDDAAAKIKSSLWSAFKNLLRADSPK